ncbi:TetR/AcrR family transcriptional regulator [Nocardia sp. 2]|uniref:TetR/AcrR family transcriptional regulator n=1 Tax=Nocardia acididurans TaxID=2802282 RepID=A0ABS1MLF8_9NOCA|nr:TetR family transcriptional regulator [Nocardia acididurans]MBL1080198.1 TetR/AcrR family transcriptional regulator [Nocardia acididurans]
MAGRTRQTEGRSDTEATARAAAVTRRTQKERSAHAAQALLDAAEELFARRGVDHTSLADIGELAGFSRGLANHHFGTKAALVDRLTERIQTRFATDAETRAETGSADALEALENLVEDYLTAIARHARSSRAFFVMLGAAFPAEASLRPVLAADDESFRERMASHVRAGQSDGSVDDTVDPVATAVMVVAMLRGTAAQYLVDPDAIDLPGAIQAAQRFLRIGLAPPNRR